MNPEQGKPFAGMGENFEVPSVMPPFLGSATPLWRQYSSSTSSPSATWTFSSCGVPGANLHES
jgi:hypothetical protein